MKSTPRVTSDIPLLSIEYKYNSRKVLVFIATKEAGSTAPGDTYLYCLPNIYSNISVCPVVSLHLLVRYSNECNAIENYNRMRQSDPALEKY